MVDDSETKGTVARAPAGAPTADGGLLGYDTTAPGHDASGGEPTIIPTWGAGDGVPLPDPGYQLGELIGRGGMGEVMVANDQRIGREVAIKRIRSAHPSPDAVTRFLREARIQARLDHPAIVPVYELGTDADGRPYFTMKRLAGETLAKRLEDRGSVQPLLRAFIDVCLAIRLAHARGVVHRDIKPSNIMLGDYGEVYVLDWGVARVMTDRRRVTHPGIVDDVDEGTTAGAILGTPGYMSPEQVRGHDVGPSSDVYALGSLLFEILAGEPLHPRGDAALASTLTSPQVAPTQRSSTQLVPPELDEVCFEALAEDPNQRPTARELADRVQSYLDGDRDLERRRTLAAEQLELAREALQSSTDDARATAMRRGGRALALDPESAEAAALVTSLILEPPAKLPPALVASLTEDDRTFNRARSRLAMWAYLSLFSVWPIIPFLAVKSWTALLAFYGVLGLAALVTWQGSRSEAGNASVWTSYTFVMLTVLGFSRLVGPFVLTPVVICVVLMSFSAVPQLYDRKKLVIVGTIVAVMLPVVLEWIGVLNTTYQFKAGHLMVTSDVFSLDSPMGEHVLVVANLGVLVVAGLFTSTVSKHRRLAQRELQIRAWHLRQLLPTTERPSASEAHP